MSDKFDSPKNPAPAGMTRRDVLKGASLAAVSIALGLGRPAWAQRGVVKFGCSLPLSGSFEKVAKLYRSGYELWTEAVGGKILVGDREMDVEWVIYDDEFNPARTAQLTERMITTDKVDCIVGTYGTDTILAQGAIARKYNKITIQAGAATRRVDDEIGGTTTFTLVPSGDMYPKLAMELLGNMNPKPKRLATITYDDAAYKEMTAAIKESAKQLGIEHVLDIELPVNTEDLRPTALKLKRAGQLDLVYSTGHDLPIIKLVQEMSALDVNVGAFVGGHLTTSPSVKATLKDKLEYVYGVTLWLPQFKYSDPHFANAQAFADKHKASKGFDPTYHSAMSYTIPLLYELALKDPSGGNPLDNQVIRKKLLAMNGQETVWGPIRFNEKGRIIGSGLPVIQWQGKDPALKVVYPKDLANAEPQYPTPPWGKRSA